MTISWTGDGRRFYEANTASSYRDGRCTAVARVYHWTEARSGLRTVTLDLPPASGCRVPAFAEMGGRGRGEGGREEGDWPLMVEKMTNGTIHYWFSSSFSIPYLLHTSHLVSLTFYISLI